MIWSVFGSPSCEYSYSPVRNESPLHSFFYKVTLHTAYNYKEHLTNWGFFYISAHYCENGDPEVLRSGFMSLSAPSQLWGNGLERKKERTTTGEDESHVPCPWARHGSVTCPHTHTHTLNPNARTCRTSRLDVMTVNTSRYIQLKSAGRRVDVRIQPHAAYIKENTAAKNRKAPTKTNQYTSPLLCVGAASRPGPVRTGTSL